MNICSLIKFKFNVYIFFLNWHGNFNYTIQTINVNSYKAFVTYEKNGFQYYKVMSSNVYCYLNLYEILSIKLRH